MKITPEAVKERIAALESAGELSLKEQFYLEALRLLVAAMDSEPVAWTWQHLKQWHVTNDEERARDLAWDGVKIEPLYRHAQQPVVSADLLHTAASAIEDLLTTKDRTGAGVWFDLPFRLRSAANAQPAPVAPVCTCPSGDGSLRWPCPVHPGNSPVIPDSCTWHCEEDINNWHSDCGYQFQFMEDGPEENGVKFCPKCGKSVAVSATEGTEE